MELAKYETAKEVWNHLQRLFMQLNFAKRYQLENDIRALHHKNKYSRVLFCYDRSL